MCVVCCALFLLFCTVWGKSARVFDPHHHLPISLAHSLPFVLMTRSPFPRRRRAGVKRYDGTTPPRKPPAPPFSSPSPSRGVAPSPAPPPPPRRLAPWPLVAAEESAIISPPAEEDRGTAQLACTPAASVSQILAVSFAADPAELSHQLDAHLANLLQGGSSGLSIASPSEPPPRHSAVYRLLPRTPTSTQSSRLQLLHRPHRPRCLKMPRASSESPPPRFGSALARIRAVAHDVVEQLGGDEHGSGT